MSLSRKQLWIVGVWSVLLFNTGWFLVLRPSLREPPGEFWKWFLVRLIDFGFIWFLDLVMILLIVLMAQKTPKRVLGLILIVWSVPTAVALWLTVFEPALLDPITNYKTYWHWLGIRLEEFAFPSFFLLLVGLYFVMWATRRFRKFAGP